ncbi:MAG: hypothetical protein ACWGSD_04900, partial [Thermodesulfobacteriota bacterium]
EIAAEALASLDDPTETQDLTRERRVMSLVVPLIQDRVTKMYSSMTEARRDPSGIRDLFRMVQTPFAVPRREQERFKSCLIGWMRLLEFVQDKNLIPASFQKKAYFERVLQWHSFHQRIAGIPEQETREALETAIRAGRKRDGRKRKRKRRKRA